LFRILSRKSKFVFLILPILTFLFFSAALLPDAAGATSDFQPILVIERVNAERAVAGSVFYLTLVVKNSSKHPALNIFAELDSPEFQGEDVFTMEAPATQESPHLAHIGGDETRSFSFPVKVSAEAQNVDYTLNISLKSQDTSFKPATPRTSTSTTVKVHFEITQPSPSVSKVILDPPVPARTEPFTAVFYLDNHSGAAAHSVFIELDGGENFRILETTASKFLPALARGGNNFVSFRLQGLDNRAANSVKLTFRYSHRGDSFTAAHTVNLPLEQAVPGTAPQLTISSFSLGETPRAHEYIIRLTLENMGEQEATGVRLTFDGEGKIHLLRTSNVAHIPLVPGKGSKELEYLLGINPAKGDTHLPLNVKLEYRDKAGNAQPPVSETLGIAVADTEAGDTPGGTPRVLISKYTLSADKVLAGNVVTLTLHIKNTHTRPVQNIKVSLGVNQVEGGNAGAGTAGGGTVFSPIKASNSFFIDRIPARTVVEHSVDLLVDPNAAARTYIIPVNIAYEDEDATGYEVRETINIPVTQESRLQVLFVEAPPTAFIGQPTFINAEFVNVGKVDLGNFMVMLEGDFPKEQAAYFVGNLQIGASYYYQGIIHPDREGTLEGKLIFSYLDNRNREVRLEKPFSIEVQAGGEMGMETIIDGEIPPPQVEGRTEVGLFSAWPYYAGALFILAAAVAIILRRRRARTPKTGEDVFHA